MKLVSKTNNGNLYNGYLGEHFRDKSTMKFFGTRNDYKEIVIDGAVKGIVITNSKAPAPLKKAYYMFITIEGYKTTKIFYTENEVKQFLSLSF